MCCTGSQVTTTCTAQHSVAPHFTFKLHFVRLIYSGFNCLRVGLFPLRSTGDIAVLDVVGDDAPDNGDAAASGDFPFPGERRLFCLPRDVPMLSSALRSKHARNAHQLLTTQHMHGNMSNHRTSELGEGFHSEPPLLCQPLTPWASLQSHAFLACPFSSCLFSSCPFSLRVLAAAASTRVILAVWECSCLSPRLHLDRLAQFRG